MRFIILFFQVKVWNEFLTFLLICGSLMTGFAQMPYYAIYEDSYLFALPNAASEKIEKLIVGEKLYFQNERGKAITKILINGEEKSGHWLSVQTQSGDIGWVHESLLTMIPPQTRYWTWVDHLRVRKEGNLQAEVIEKLRENSKLIFTGQRSFQKDKITLRQQTEFHYWLQVITPSGRMGWVYGGGLALQPKNKIVIDLGKTTEPNRPKEPTLPINPNDNPIYNEQQLRTWWLSLSTEWKNFFNERILGKDISELYNTPSADDLLYILSLKELDLSNNDVCNTGPFYAVPIRDLSGLQSLKNLEKLYLDYINFDNLKFLGGLNKLRVLSIRETTFNSLQGIEVLQALELLEIAVVGKASIDLELIGQLQNLEDLSLKMAQMADFKNLAGLKKLNKLKIEVQKLGSLAGLETFNKLKFLYIDAANSVLTMNAPLRNLTELNSFSLLCIGVDNLEELRFCKSLNFLLIVLHQNQIDLSFIENLQSLKELELRCAEIVNPNILSKLSNLRAVFLSYTETFDFEALKNCKNIWALDVDARTFLHMEQLPFFDKLSRLSLSSNSIQSLKQLPSLHHLHYLRIKSFNLQSTEGITAFPMLYSADFIGCQKLNLLKDIEQLKYLNELLIPNHIDLSLPPNNEVLKHQLILRRQELKGC